MKRHHGETMNRRYRGVLATVIALTSLTMQAAAVNWEVMESTGAGDLYYVRSAGDHWVTIGNQSPNTGVIYSAPVDATAWKPVFARTDIGVGGIAVVGDTALFGLAGQTGQFFARSDDAQTLHRASNPREEAPFGTWANAFSVGDRYYLAEQLSSNIWNSADGQSWTRLDLPIEDGDIIFAGAAFRNKLVFVGSSNFDSQPLIITRSVDGTTTRSIPEGLQGALRAIATDGENLAVAGGQFAIPGESEESGFVLRSTDGNLWEPSADDLPGFVSGIAHNGSAFAIAGSGLLATSTDLQSWEHSPLEFNFQLFDVAAMGDVFMAVGAAGVTLLGKSEPDESAAVRLSTKRQDQGLELSWPDSAKNFGLESSTNARGPYSRSNLTPTATADGRVAIQLPVTHPRQFFRLRRNDNAE